MAIRVLVNGAQGRMGQAVVKALQTDPALSFVAGINRNEDLRAAITQYQAQVVVDFTTPAAVYQNTKIMLDAGAHPVIGTTGLQTQQINEFTEYCLKLERGAVIAPNFSIGAVLMMQCAQEIARHYASVEIIEMHHAGKLDAPSGTAIKTAEMIAKNLLKNAAEKSSHESIPGCRGGKSADIPIHSVRLPGLVAHQEVIFGGVGETLTLRHDSIDRVCFMPGVLVACKKVVELKQLVYGLEHLL